MVVRMTPSDARTIRASRTGLTVLSGAVVALAMAAPVAASAAADPAAASALAAAVRPDVSAVSPAAGRTTGGNTVTIAGTDLGAATAVYFASVKATHLVHVSSTRLTVDAPAVGARTVHIRVAGPGGRSPEITSDRYTYVAHAPRQTWGKLGTADAQHDVNDLSCASARSCTTVDAGGYAVHFDGKTWSGRTQIDKGRNVTMVDCPGIHFCVAIDTADGTGTPHSAIVESAGKWRPTRTVLTKDDINDLSCSSQNLCVAVTSTGHAIDYRNGTWSDATTIDTVSVNGVSCPDDNFCLAVDDNGNEVVFNGTSWSAPRSTGIDYGEFSANLYGISCVSRYYCVAGNSRVIVRRNGLWAATGLSALHNDGFSCATPLFCFVVAYNDETTSPKYFFSGAAAVRTNTPFNATYDYPVVDCPASGNCVAVLGRKYSVSRPRR